jgi:hypothetical protein
MILKALMAAGKAASAVGGAAKGAAGAVGGALGGGGGAKGVTVPKVTEAPQAPTIAPGGGVGKIQGPQQSFGNVIQNTGRDLLSNYMASQGIDMKNRPTSFGQGLQQVAKRYAGMSDDERSQRATPMLMAERPDSGKLSDFIGTVQTSERRKQKNLPF